MRKSLVLMAVILVALMATAVMAGEYGQKGDKVTKAIKANKTGSAHMTLEGTVVCTGCELKKGEGARAECGEFGHSHALKTADGQYVNLLENKYSKDLLSKKYHNKKVSVHGVHYANANILDVESFDSDGQKKSWCGGCSKMDGCSSK